VLLRVVEYEMPARAPRTSVPAWVSQLRGQANGHTALNLPRARQNRNHALTFSR
jgi:hypothetical protein